MVAWHGYEMLDKVAGIKDQIKSQSLLSDIHLGPNAGNTSCLMQWHINSTSRDQIIYLVPATPSQHQCSKDCKGTLMFINQAMDPVTSGPDRTA